MAGLHLVIQMSKFRAPYLVRKRGIFYLQKRIPQQLTGHYGRTFVRRSLRTKDRLEASKLASQLVRGLERLLSLARRAQEEFRTQVFA